MSLIVAMLVFVAAVVVELAALALVPATASAASNPVTATSVAHRRSDPVTPTPVPTKPPGKPLTTGSGPVTRPNIRANAVSGAEVTDAGCSTSVLPANDDGSTGSVNLPFVGNFFGTSYQALFVNNNGNVTFRGPQSTFTPFTINANTPPIIAPFFADVDTRGAGSSLVTYGTTTFGSRQALCVNWNGVGYFANHADKLNSFQLLLVDRSDTGAGDFDVVMNYGTLIWETGDASGGTNGFGGTPAGAGFSAGDGNASHFFQFPGSLTHLGLLDSNQTTGLVNNSRGTLQNGRYIFPVRNGVPPGSARFTGAVRDAAGHAQSAAPVQACPVTGGSCVTGFSNADGRYSIIGVPSGSWNLTANPPAGSGLLPDRAGPLDIATGATVTHDFVLRGPTGPPAGTTITDRGTTPGGIPVLYWNDPITLNTTGCAGGTASYTLTLGSGTVRSGALTESPAGSGHYQAQIAPLFPDHGDATVHITFTCPDGSHPDITFSIYIDPSGTVVDTAGAPVQGATVTLLRGDTSTGPFTAVPDGSAVMSPSNRTNPFVTGPDGIFHWDVIAGFYQIQATKQGCLATDGSPAATSAVNEIPPPVTNLQLVLNCGPTAPTTTTTQLSPNPPTPTAANTVETLTATVTPTAAGSVQFKDGATNIGNAATVTNGTASITTTLASGTHSLTAVFTPTNPAAFTGSTSTAVTYTVNAAVTSTTLGATPPTPTAANTVETLTATVTPTAAAGSVQFKDGATNIGNAATVTNGTASITTTLASGTHSLTAVFTPTNPAAFTGSTSTAVTYTVNAAVTSTTLGATPASPAVKNTVETLTATVTPTAAGSVQFKDGTTNIGNAATVTNGTATITTTLPVGTHSLTAVFTPTNPVAFTGSASTAVPYVVYTTATSTTLTVSPNPAFQGLTVFLFAQVAPFNAAGTVQFTDGATALGAPVPVTAGFAVLNTSTLAKGQHTLTAVFTPTDPVAFGPSTSPPVPLTVQPLFPFSLFPF